MFKRSKPKPKPTAYSAAEAAQDTARILALIPANN